MLSIQSFLEALIQYSAACLSSCTVVELSCMPSSQPLQAVPHNSSTFSPLKRLKGTLSLCQTLSSPERKAPTIIIPSTSKPFFTPFAHVLAFRDFVFVHGICHPANDHPLTGLQDAGAIGQVLKRDAGGRRANDRARL